MVGNGHGIDNHGPVKLKLNAQVEDQQVNSLTSTFQVATATRPLMSVSKLCDQGMTATFDDKRALVRDASISQTRMTLRIEDET